MRPGISLTKQEELRGLFDRRINKAEAARQTGHAEATVYRYYTKWAALTSTTAFDLTHLDPSVVVEYEIQARMRGMSVYAFIFRILNTIKTDNLFKSIVDIDEDDPGSKRLVEK